MLCTENWGVVFELMCNCCVVVNGIYILNIKKWFLPVVSGINLTKSL